MVIKTATQYVNDTLVERLKDLQNALNQAERIISKLEEENESLKSALNSMDADEVKINSWAY